MTDIESNPTPQGSLQLKVVALPSDTNFNGDVFGGWLVSQMDLAGSLLATNIASGRVATVAMESMSFLSPVKVGECLSIYTEILSKGSSSLTLAIEVWSEQDSLPVKITDGVFVFVAIDESGRTRTL